jgi:hypothetical protein
MTSAIFLHNSVIKPYTYGVMNSTYSLKADVQQVSVRKEAFMEYFQVPPWTLSAETEEHQQKLR